ncbi:uncharacterized protein LOC101847238 [Aplysia californica]|uniref:Uncharacterized protein LOC101847238 n=1 Tax=Aplysia californica TaxID=6500 RepID=A0ABM0K9U9_APLCA|nr:uncharacterized protein LOC101847238 [Aplysia californica]
MMAGRTEFFVKMNRLILPELESQSAPVRFRPVFYDPHLVEERQLDVEDESDQSDVETEQGKGKHPLPHFFKDPLAGPSADLTKEDTKQDETDTNLKLGRNMRASSGLIGATRQKDIHELMNTRRQLLQQQKEQIELVSEEENSEQAASILVNNLLLKGFHISAPSDSSLPSPFRLPQKNEVSSEEELQASAERQKLIGAFHRELVRVHAKDTSDG